MTKKKKKIRLIIVVIVAVLIIFLFSKVYTSKKIFSPDKQYSVYAQTYVYSELLCAFSYMDCWHYGKIYLYDEQEKKVLESVFTDATETYESVSWITQGNMVLFKNIGIKIPNNFWYLPRPLELKSIEK